MKYNFLNKRVLPIVASGIVVLSLNSSVVKAYSVNTVMLTNETTYNSIDDNMIKTFNNMETEITTLLDSKDESIKDKAKGTFILMVDFIFFDGEINGVKFNELTEEGKQKILKIATSIDTKIENKFPNYKDTIADTTKEAFKKASELIKKGAESINEFAKEKLSEENYNALIDAKDNLAKYSKNAIDLFGKAGKFIWNSTSGLREDAKELIDKGAQKIKDWYNNFKNN